MGKGITRIIVLAVVVVIFLGVGIAIGQDLSGKNQDGAVAKEVTIEDIIVFNIQEPIITNLADEGIIRVSVGLGVDSNNQRIKNFETYFVENQIIIRDDIIGILRNKTYESVNKPEAGEEVGEAIKQSINELLGDDYVYKVYFKEFLVQ